jgi:Domain of unknown function (DUF4397)
LYHRSRARRQRDAFADIRRYTCALCARGSLVTRTGSVWFRCAAYACVAVVAALLAGCGGSSSGGTFFPVTGFIRAVNTIPDSPTLSAGVTALVASRVSFAQATSLNAVSGGVNYTFNAQYLSGVTAVPVVSNLTVPVSGDQQVSIFLMGSLATPTTKLVTNPIADIAAGEAEFQIVHAATSQTTLDVYLTDAAAPLAGATPITLAYEAASDLMTVPASTNYRLRVTAPGDGTVLYDSGAFPLASLARTTFVLVDYFGPGGNGFRIVQLTNIAAATFPNEALPGALRVANMVANQSAIDVYVGGVGGAPTFGDVAFGTIGARQQFGAGALNVTVTPAQTPGTVLFTGTVTLNSGESRTLAFALNGSDVVGRFALDSTRPISVQPQLQSVQASPSSGNVDIYLLSAGETVDDVGAALPDLPLLSVTSTAPTAGAYDVEVTPAGDKTVVVGPVPIVLDDAGIYTMYLSDTPGGGLPAQIILADDFN